MHSKHLVGATKFSAEKKAFEELLDVVNNNSINKLVVSSGGELIEVLEDFLRGLKNIEVYGLTFDKRNPIKISNYLVYPPKL